MPPNQAPQDEERRTFLKVLGILIIGAGVAGTLRSVVQNVIPPVSNVSSSFPSLTLVSQSGTPIHTSDLTVNNPSVVTFNYPLQNEPNFLLRLGNTNNVDVAVKPEEVTVPSNGGKYQSPGGVGPYGSVVSSSAICQHLGCIPPEIRYHPPSSTSFPGKIHCDCHGSTYDPFNGFSVVTGPTRSPLPSLVLKYDSKDDTYAAVMMTGPTIYGHTSDLSGGDSITTTGTAVSST